jgi:hypothetical protein
MDSTQYLNPVISPNFYIVDIIGKLFQNYTHLFIVVKAQISLQQSFVAFKLCRNDVGKWISCGGTKDP